MEKEISESPSRIGYFISGAVVGSVVALLFAPKAGREMREDVRDWIDEKRRAGREAVKEAVSTGTETLRRARREVGV